MKAAEPLSVRMEMVQMHDKYGQALDDAMKNGRYVEATWLCYAIFEQRINRLIEKHLHKCPKEPKKKGKPAAISTRIKCIKKLIEKGYGGYGQLDKKEFERIESWCDRRNKLTHGLVSLEKYQKYDREFKALAQQGYPLVKELYKEGKTFREWWYATDSLEVFPDIKCQCKQQCIKTNNYEAGGDKS